MAKEEWADVRLIVGSGCENSNGEGSRSARGLSYLSVSDHLTFGGYWPWSTDIYHDLIEYDGAGMTSNIRPCPHTLPDEEIALLRTVAQEALAASNTDAERRMLARIDQRLAVTNGAALGTRQWGCADVPLEYGATIETADLWSGEKKLRFRRNTLRQFEKPAPVDR